MTTIAPTVDTAPAPSPSTQSFDRAARIIFGTMVGLIVLLTALLLETSASTAAAADGVALPAPAATHVATGR